MAALLTEMKLRGVTSEDAQVTEEGRGLELLEADLAELDNSIYHLVRSNVELAQFLREEPGDLDLEQALQENQTALVKKRLRAKALRNAISDLRASNPHLAERPNRHTSHASRPSSSTSTGGTSSGVTSSSFPRDDTNDRPFSSETKVSTRAATANSGSSVGPPAVSTASTAASPHTTNTSSSLDGLETAAASDGVATLGTGSGASCASGLPEGAGAAVVEADRSRERSAPTERSTTSSGATLPAAGVLL